MRPRQGFTLIEALIALIIASGMFVLASGVDRQLLRPLRTDPIAWYQAVRVLEQPGRYRAVSIDRQQLNLEDLHQDRKPVAVWVDAKHVLRLTNSQHQGYYPLLRRVVAVQWRATASPVWYNYDLNRSDYLGKPRFSIYAARFLNAVGTVLLASVSLILLLVLAGQSARQQSTLELIKAYNRSTSQIERTTRTPHQAIKRLPER